MLCAHNHKWTERFNLFQEEIKRSNICLKTEQFIKNSKDNFVAEDIKLQRSLHTLSEEALLIYRVMMKLDFCNGEKWSLQFYVYKHKVTRTVSL